MQLAAALTNAGFENTRTRHNGQRMTVWIAPPAATLGFGDGMSDGF